MSKPNIADFLDNLGLHGLNESEKAGIENLMNTPGKDEFFFLLRLIGITPTQVRSKMAKEFTRRFGRDALSDEMLAALPVGPSWRELTDAVAGFAESPTLEEQRQFWDRMRYILAALPRRASCRYGCADAPEPETPPQPPPRRTWNHGTCRHCWRRVVYNSGSVRKTAGYCFEHNLPAAHPAYRRRSQLARRIAPERQAVAGKLAALLAACPSGTDAHEILFAQLTAADGCLPRLAKYLHGIGHDGSPESLLWAFHGPASGITEPLYRDALAEYIQYVLDAGDPLNSGRADFIFSMDELSVAEAWLTVLEHGGGKGI